MTTGTESHGREWTAELIGHGGLRNEVPVYTIRSESGETIVSTVAGADKAHLIAAAPALLEALEYLVAECDPDMDAEYNPHAAPLAKAQAALSRAHGDSK